ncbi:MAG: hypothetical protein IJK35_01340 [Oscillospiraceae bacterium]|nr:hypothetical protein [Oscillospiraceae bacterium]
MELFIDRKAPRRPTVFSWQFGLGNCHAYLLHRTDVCEHIKLAHDELGIKYIRCHGVLDDDMLTYQRMGDCRMFSSVPGKNKIAEINFRQVGHVYDNLLACGVKPFVELSFMPTALASGKKLGLRYDPNITMPKSLDAWGDYICRFVHFLLDRYGAQEVESWYFEVWNEPDLGCFFAGSQQDYFKLYEVTAKAIKSVDERLRVGGPSTSACKWLPEFLDFCEKSGSPCDFVSTHHYPGDAFGNFINFANIKHMFAASRNAVKNGRKLSEAMTDMFFLPEDAKRWEKGTLARMDREARAQVGDKPLFITEWNSMAVFGSPVHDEKYSAAFAVKSCLDLDGSADAYMFWCCSDLFEEQFMLPRPFVGSYGIVSNDGIPKPNFWGFKLLSQLYPQRLALPNTGDMDCGAFTDGENVQLLLTPQSGDYYANKTYSVDFTLDFEASEVTVQRIDDEHCNPKKLWQALGEPDNLTREQVAEIREKTRLRTEPLPFTAAEGKTRLSLTLSTNDVALITAKVRK